MSEFQNHPEFYNQPVLLNPEEIQFPTKVVTEFFADYTLSELREIHDNMEEVCLTTDAPPFVDGEKRSDFLYYHYNLIRLLEAAFIISQNSGQQ